MSTAEERGHIRNVLIPEILESFDSWSHEYQQERDLGLRGEFANLYRKSRKLKTVLWDGADPTFWRESLRTIVKEVVGHGLLMLVDIDVHKEGGTPRPAREPDALLTYRKPSHPEEGKLSCGPGCTPRKHLFSGECRYRLAGDRIGPAEEAGNDAC